MIKPTPIRNLYHCVPLSNVNTTKIVKTVGKFCNRFYSNFTAKIAVFGNVLTNSKQNIVGNIAVYGNLNN